LIASAADNPLAEAGAAFSALRRGIVRSRGFSLHLCTCDAPTTRDRLIDNLAASLPALTVHRVQLPDPADQEPLEAVAAATATAPGPVMVVGLEALLADGEQAERLLSALNLSRGDWPTRVPHPVVFWLPRRLLGRLTAGAPDFFDWRSDTLDFPELAEAQVRPFAAREWRYGVDPRFTREEQDQRLRELVARLAATRDSDDERICRRRLAWWDELAELKKMRGELDEALRIRTEEQIPVYERLGDVHSKAVTQGRIADILQARGDLDEAFALHQERLPAFERLGDIDGIAHVRFATARLRLARGEHERGGIQAIYDDLAGPYEILRRLGRPDGIGPVGLLLAQVLAIGGHRDEALAVLDEAEAAFAKLGQTAAIEQVRERRRLIAEQ
jgi:hypothetical protein